MNQNYHKIITLILAKAEKHVLYALYNELQTEIGELRV